MIRPIVASNYKTNFRTNNYRPNFGHSEEMIDEDYEEIREGRKNSGLWGLAAGAALVTILDFAMYFKDQFEKKDFMEKFMTIQNDKDIQKDTFTVKDVNNDKVPDIILYKKDGSEVVFDVNNCKILEGKLVNKTDYKEIK